MANRGHTLLELTISMAITSVLALGFMQAFGGMSRGIQKELQVGTYEDNVRLTLQQFTRDIRLTASNPNADPTLYDGDPTTDVAVELDPDQDGKLTNGILLRSNRTESAAAASSAQQTMETILYHYDSKTYRLYRHVWYSIPNEASNAVSSHSADKQSYDQTPLLDNVCSFSLSYLTNDEVATTDPAQVVSVDVRLTTAAGSKGCADAWSFSRSSYARIRIRNR